MHIIIRTVFGISVLLLSGVVFLSCDRNRHIRGHDYIPDMVYSQAYDTYSENPNFSDNMTMRVPVTGTVPRGFTPFRYNLEPESRIQAGKDLINPYSPAEEIIEEGKILYTIFCIGCHGPQGDGDGYLFTQGLYPLKPRELSGPVVAGLRDGEIFHTITLGFGAMGPHGSQIKYEDRWKIVHYVRDLQKK